MEDMKPNPDEIERDERIKTRVELEGLIDRLIEENPEKVVRKEEDFQSELISLESKDPKAYLIMLLKNLNPADEKTNFAGIPWTHSIELFARPELNQRHEVTYFFRSDDKELIKLITIPSFSGLEMKVKDGITPDEMLKAQEKGKLGEAIFGEDAVEAAQKMMSNLETEISQGVNGLPIPAKETKWLINLINEARVLNDPLKD